MKVEKEIVQNKYINKNLVIEPKIIEEPYEKRRMNKHLYEFSNANPKMAIKDEITKTKTLTQGGLIISFANNSSLSQSSIRLLNTIITLANYQGLNKDVVYYSLDEYMQRLGLTCTRKEASRKLRKDLNFLQDIKISHEDKVKALNYSDMRILGSIKAIHGNVRIRIDGEFLDLLKITSAIDMPKDLEQIDGNKYPNAYGVYLYVSDMIFQEMHKGNGRVLSVQSLLKNTFSFLPREETVKQRKQSPKHRILYPFIEELNYLEDKGFLYYKWCGKGGKELTDEEKNNIENDFNLFKQSYIYFKLPSDYPNQDKLISTRKEYIKEAKENKKKLNSAVIKEKAKMIAKQELKQEGKN